MQDHAIPSDLSLGVLVRHLAVARKAEAELKEKVEAEQDKFLRKTVVLLTDYKTVKKTREDLEAKVRGLGTALYAASGERYPAPGISIRNEVVIAYKEDEAFAWARANGMCLVLDTTSFDKVAKVMQPPLPFVTRTLQPKVTIAKDLDAALEGETEATEAPDEPSPSESDA